MPRKVAAEEQRLLHSLAEKITSDLRITGLPTTYVGDCWGGGVHEKAGVVVYYDPSLGGSGGVFVAWRLDKNVLAEVRAVSLSGDLSNSLVKLASSTLEVMRRALVDILKGAGWVVDVEDVGVHESSIKVTRKL